MKFGKIETAEYHIHCSLDREETGNSVSIIVEDHQPEVFRTKSRRCFQCWKNYQNFGNREKLKIRRNRAEVPKTGVVGKFYGRGIKTVQFNPVFLFCFLAKWTPYVVPIRLGIFGLEKPVQKWGIQILLLRLCPLLGLKMRSKHPSFVVVGSLGSKSGWLHVTFSRECGVMPTS